MFAQTILIMGLILAGLAQIVYRPATREIAKLVFAVILTEAILWYLWEDGIGRLALILAAMLIWRTLAR